MKKTLVLAACLILISISAHAQVLPDAGTSLDVNGQQQMTDYGFSQDYVCDVWVYPRDSRTDNRMTDWIISALHSGYIVSCITVEGQTAYRLEDENGLYALMFPQYQGAVMLMIQRGMTYAPNVATPMPRPTVQPTVQPVVVPVVPSSNAGEWGWVWMDVEKDCPSCYGGKCSVCNGSGIYRLYGEEVWCRIYCSSCDGLGTYTTKEYQYVRLN